MKSVVVILSLLVAQLFSSSAFADRAQCVNSLRTLMVNVERDVRMMPKSEPQVHKHCVMWLYDRAAYEAVKQQKDGEDPCSSTSKDWRNILTKLLSAYTDAKTVCANKKVCDKGCGKALSVIRSGGSQSSALKAIPQDS